VHAAIAGSETLDLDTLLGVKGLFGGNKFAISSVDKIGDSVNKFSNILNLPGVLNIAYSQYAVRW